MATVPKPGPVVYWITRDSDESSGAPDDCCDVWRELPVRITLGAGAFWLSEPWSLEHREGRYTLAAIQRWIGTVPDDDRQVIRAERNK